MDGLSDDRCNAWPHGLEWYRIRDIIFFLVQLLEGEPCQLPWSQLGGAILHPTKSPLFADKPMTTGLVLNVSAWKGQGYPSTPTLPKPPAALHTIQDTTLAYDSILHKWTVISLKGFFPMRHQNQNEREEVPPWLGLFQYVCTHGRREADTGVVCLLRTPARCGSVKTAFVSLWRCHTADSDRHLCSGILAFLLPFHPFLSLIFMCLPWFI